MCGSGTIRTQPVGASQVFPGGVGGGAHQVLVGGQPVTKRVVAAACALLADQAAGDGSFQPAPQGGRIRLAEVRGPAVQNVLASQLLNGVLQNKQNRLVIIIGE